MLASTMPSAAAQVLRACGRNLPAVKSMPAVGPSSTISRVLARRTFLISPSYKARVAIRGYATATATTTKKSPTTRTKARIAPANAKKKTPAAKKEKAKPKAKKAKAKPKKVLKKKKPGPVRQPLSPEKKAVLARRELKRVAMFNQEPKKASMTIWTTYVAERLQNENVSGPGKDFGKIMTRLAADFKSLSSSETSRIEQKILETKATNAANYKKWVESHTVAAIYKANVARARLVRLHNVKTRKLIDERMPKRPGSAFSHYVKAKMSSQNDGRGMIAAVKQISATWKSMSAVDKKPYEDLTLADSSRYAKEIQGLGLPATRSAARL